MTASRTRTLKFQEFACLVDVSFWQTIINQKLNVWKLACPPLPLKVLIEPAPSLTAKPILRLDAECARHGLNDEDGPSLTATDQIRGATTAEGTLYHVNTMAEFLSFPYSQKVADCLTPYLDLLAGTLKPQNGTTAHAGEKRRAASCSAKRPTEIPQIHGTSDWITATTCTRAASTRSLQHLLTQRLIDPDDDDSTSSIQADFSIDWSSAMASVICPFFIVAYMDLKHYAMTYAVSCPTVGLRMKGRTVVPPPSPKVLCPVSPNGSQAILNKLDFRFANVTNPYAASEEFSIYELQHIGKHLTNRCCCNNDFRTRLSTERVCLVLVTSSPVRAIKFISLTQPAHPRVRERLKHDSSTPDESQSHWKVFLAVIDYSRSETQLSWPVRNLLFAVIPKMGVTKDLQLLAFRDLHFPVSLGGNHHPVASGSTVSFTGSVHSEWVSHSRIFTLHVPKFWESSDTYLIGGWLSHQRAGVPPRLRAQLEDSSHKTSELPLPRGSVFNLDLQSFLNRHVVQQNATELNVKLIKWRILPSFQPQNISNIRFLVIGMGTLGCHICRELVGWGAMRLTLVDCAVVAPSNPARQSLYLASDVEGISTIGLGSSGGEGSRKSKVTIAKERLLQVRGDLEIEAIDLEIPMPNQERFLLPVGEFLGTQILAEELTSEDQQLTYAAWMNRKLRRLVATHDCVWLLTDSRESRWLPSLVVQNASYVRAKSARERRLAAQLNGQDPPIPTGCVEDRELDPFTPPLCITVALGFDTFVAIRHGTFSDCPIPPEISLPPPDEEPRGIYRKCDVFRSRLSCYFCNDLSAPTSVESRFRTLDQQCTVTRTGIAPFASAVAVELLAALSQAPYGFGSLPTERRKELIQKLKSNEAGWSRELVEDVGEIVADDRHISCLGDLPHVTRGSLASFTVQSDWHPAFDSCVCCSEAVQERYARYQDEFVEEVVRDSSRLEEISGLAALRRINDSKGGLILSNEDRLTDGDVLLLVTSGDEDSDDGGERKET